jgi:hypothetical protein
MTFGSLSTPVYTNSIYKLTIICDTGEAKSIKGHSGVELPNSNCITTTNIGQRIKILRHHYRSIFIYLFIHSWSI